MCGAHDVIRGMGRGGEGDDGGVMEDLMEEDHSPCLLVGKDGTDR